MFGYVASKFIPLMIMEFCESGDLLNYVKKNEERLRVYIFKKKFMRFKDLE